MGKGDGLDGDVGDRVLTVSEGSRALAGSALEQRVSCSLIAAIRISTRRSVCSCAATRACDEWSTVELQQLQAMLYLARESKFDDVYQGVDDNRRMRKEWDDIEKDWAGLTDLMKDLDDDHVAHRVRRDGHCHEAVMWFVHHLTTDVKKMFADAGVVVPLLSLAPHSEPPAGADSAHKAAHAVYQEQVTCSSCHAQY